MSTLKITLFYLFSLYLCSETSQKVKFPPQGEPHCPFVYTISTVQREHYILILHPI